MPTDPDAVAALTAELGHVETALNDTRRSNERRTLMFAAAIAVAILVALVAAVLAWSVKAAFDEFTDQRAQARAVACDDDNVVRVTFQQQAMALATAETLARAEEDPARVEQALDYLRPVKGLRVCTDEAIAAYYESGGVQGVAPIPWPAHVLEFLARHPLEPVDP